MRCLPPARLVNDAEGAWVIVEASPEAYQPWEPPLEDLDEEVERVAGEQTLGDVGRVVVPEREHRDIPAAEVADMPDVVALDQAGVPVPDVDDRREQYRARIVGCGELPQRLTDQLERIRFCR